MPTTSNAINAPGAATGDNAKLDPSPAPGHAADAAAQFEALLFAGALAPLSNAIGTLGDVLTTAIATQVARGTHDEFYRQLEAMANHHASDDGPSPAQREEP